MHGGGGETSSSKCLPVSLRVVGKGVSLMAQRGECREKLGLGKKKESCRGAPGLQSALPGLTTIIVASGIRIS